MNDYGAKKSVTRKFCSFAQIVETLFAAEAMVQVVGIQGQFAWNLRWRVDSQHFHSS
jgi:hypothetical protein